MINAAKNAPTEPPTCIYQNDTTVTVNNMRKQLFQYCYRWIYKNLDVSTASPVSKLALPDNFSDVDTQNDPNDNNNVRITFATGGKDFQSVEILGRASEGNEYGDWFSITTLNRDDYGYNEDTDYTFDFYNDGVYAGVLLTTADQTFSYLPDKANSLELLRGNTIISGCVS